MNGLTTTGKVARLALTGIATAASFAVLAGPASAASTTCDLVAAPNGSDAAAGTDAAPLKTAQKLVDSLAPGQTGCLRSGLYRESDNEVGIDTPNTTLTSYPGERAQITGRIWVSKQGDGVLVSDLDLDGRNPTELPSPTINADDVVLRGNDITNGHTAICVSLGSADSYGRARNTLIEGNKIHDCGHMPATNQDHGIYVNTSDNAVIRDNFIYDNADRGIQLYPDAQNTLVTGNVIDGNGQGVIFGGSEISASSNNTVQNNVITNSKIRDNLDASWAPGKVGNGNVARNNCVGGGAYDDGDGGILDGQLGFKALDNLIKVPDFVNRKAGDFSIAGASPCSAILAGGKAPASPNPSASPSPPASTSPSAVTIDTSKTTVDTTETVAVTGKAKGATVVRVMALRNGHWTKVGTSKPTRAGKYRMKVRLVHAGRQRLKAVAGGLKDSRRIKVKVQK